MSTAILLAVALAVHSESPTNAAQHEQQHSSPPADATARHVAETIERLRKGDSVARREAARELRTTAERRPQALKAAVPALTATLDDVGYDNARYDIIEAVGLTGPDASSAVPQLKRLLECEDIFDKTQAALAWSRIDPDNAAPVERLSGWLNAECDTLRGLAAFNLGKLGPRAEAALPALRRLLKDDHAAVRFVAASAVWDVGGPSDAALQELMRIASGTHREALVVRPTFVSEWLPPLSFYAIAKLGEIGPQAEASVPLLVEQTANEEHVIRLTAVRALAQIGSRRKDVLEALRRVAAEDPVGTVQEAARKTLENLEAR
jgi:HEAT repeat protein